MSITLVQHKTVTSNTALTLSSSTTAGNCLIVLVGNYGGTTAPTGVTLGGSAGNFAQVATGANTGSDAGHVAVWADPNCAGGQTAIGITGTIAQGIIFAYEVSGLATSSPLDVSSGSATTSVGTTFSSGTTSTTAQAAEFWVGMAFDNSGTATVTCTGPSSPWTNFSAVSPPSNYGATSGYQITTSTGTATYSGTGTSGGIAAVVATFLPATSNTTSTGSMALSPLKMSGTVAVANPVTTSGSLALPPLAMSGTGNNGVIPSSGSVALPPLAMSGTGKVGNIGTGSLALSPLHMSATDTETYSATGGLALSPLALSGTVYQAFPFPQSVLNLLFELNVGGTWTDITDYVYQRATITIVRGRPDESSAGTSNPATCTFQLNNRGGQFSPRNPLSPYYGLIGRNTQFRVSAQSDAFTPDLTYRFWGEIAEWPPSWDQTGNDIYVSITANGILRRLNQNAALRSALFRYYATLDTAPLAWWPAEDGSLATSLASGLPGGFPMTFTGAPTLASDSGLASAAPFPAMNGAVFTGATGVAGALPVANTAVFTSSGSWTAPAGVNAILTQCWGGGGTGSGYNGNTGGAGGGGGEYASGSLAVTPGNAYSYTVGSAGGTTTMHGDSSTTVVAHGGGSGSSDGTTGGTGGTGSSATTHYAGGAGAAGSGGPGGSGSESQSSQTFTSSGTWSCPSNYVPGSLTVYLWGPGAGGAGGGASDGGGAGGGGAFTSANPGVSAGNNYSVTVGTGGAGGGIGDGGIGPGPSKFNGSFSTSGGSGGTPGAAGGLGGETGTYDGGSGGFGGGGNKGGGGGGGASIGGGGGSGQGGPSGGAGAGGGGGSGSVPAGGSGGNGGISTSGSRTGKSGSAPGGGGGGGYTNASSTGGSGGSGARGEVQCYWYTSTAAPAAAVGGGGGSSGGSASAGNAGATEAGGAAVTGGGPGGGTLAGSSFNASPTSLPGGGGGGYDSLGGNAAGAKGLISVSWAAGGAPAAGVTANVMRFVLHIPSGGDVDGSVVARMYTTGTIDYADVIYNTANGGSLTLSGFTGAGAQLFTTGEVTFGADGVYLLVSAELTTSGSNVAYKLTGIIAGESTAAATSTGTLTSASLGEPFDAVMNPAGTLMSTSWAHLTLQESGYDTITALAGPLAAYAGETAAARFVRVCTEQGIPYVFTDAAGYTDSTALVGPQLPVKVTQLLQDCEDADRGLLFETRDSFGVAYRSRYSLYVQDPAVQLDYGIAELAFPLQPTDDDQLLRNDVTMSRPNGSSSEFQVTTGPLSVSDPPDGVGPYTFSQSPNVYDDSQLPDLASWTAYIGTVDELRYPQINLDMARQEILPDFADTVAADIGDHLQVIDTASAPLPPGNIDQLIYGYTETLNAYQWVIAATCVPEVPYEIALADDGTGTLARANTDGSQLHSGIGTGDTSFAVDTPSPNAVWIDLADYGYAFPFGITIAGEDMTVTEIDGTSSPQTFTVTRSVNGVQKAHNAGEAVSLTAIAYAAL